MTGTFRRWAAGILAALVTVLGPGRGLQAAAAEIPETNFAGEEKAVYLDIDSRYAYEGMEQSFSEGYRPEVKDGRLYLVIPFIANGDLAADRLTVSLGFPEPGTSPFLLKNYQKMVEKKQYGLKNGKMTCLETAGEGIMAPAGGTEAYLYCVEIPLAKETAAGQYAVNVRAVGYTEQMRQVSFALQIFISLAGAEENQTGTGETGTQAGNQEGNGEAGAGDQAGDGATGTGDQTGMEKGNGESQEGDKGGYEAGGGSAAGGSAEELIRSPKLLLEENGVSKNEFAAGSENTLKVKLKNYSGEQPLYNLKVIVSAENPGVQLSRNSFYVRKVAPEETVELESVLKVAPDAADGASALILEMEYEDKRGNAVAGRETAVLSVRQPVKVEFSTGEIPGAVYASDTLELSLRACNVGRAQVFNVRASLSAEGLVPDGEVFMGNLEAGAEGKGSMRIYAGTGGGEAAGNPSGGNGEDRYGTVNGTLTLQYEDAEGRVYEETRPFQTEVKKAEILSFAVEEPEETNSWWTSIAVTVFAGLFLGILLLLWQLRRKNRLLAEAVSGGEAGYGEGKEKEA